MSAHTKGKWGVVPWSAKEAPVVAFNDDKEALVASSCLLGDARLIAAAPELLEAAQTIIAQMSGTYKARNGREMGVEAEDGEKCWIVHSDDILTLEIAIKKAVQS